MAHAPMAHGPSSYLPPSPRGAQNCASHAHACYTDPLAVTACGCTIPTEAPRAVTHQARARSLARSLAPAHACIYTRAHGRCLNVGRALVALAHRDDVVDLEDHAYALSRKGDGTRVHEQRLNHVLLRHVRDAVAPHVDTGVRVALSVLLAELGHDVNRVEARVLRESERHDLESLGVRAYAVGLHASLLLRPFAQLESQLGLRHAAARNQEALLDQRAHHAERVVDRAVRLVERQFVGTAHQNGAGAARVGDARDLDHALGAARHGHLVAQLGRSELVSGERVDVRDRHTVERARDEVDVVALDVGDDHDAHLREEVEAQVVVRVAEDRLLDQDHRAASLLDLLAQTENVFTLFPQDAVHRRVIAHHHIVLHITLGRRQTKLDETNLGVLDVGRAARRLLRPLIEHETVDELCVIDGATDLFDNLNVVQVHVSGGVSIDHTEHGVDGYRADGVRVL
mmetsp:Transcript_644/g.1633  ORF Transcript_644/g.1633 Transcript_644/m.1633 type:complete len:457 (+) Transcript_644:97-1467(+)